MVLLLAKQLCRALSRSDAAPLQRISVKRTTTTALLVLWKVYTNHRVRRTSAWGFDSTKFCDSTWQKSRFCIHKKSSLAKVFVCYRVDNSTNLFCENYTWYSMAIRLVRLRVSSSKRTSNGREKELTSSSQSRFKVTFQYYSVFIEVIL